MAEWLNGQRKLFPGHPKAKLSLQGPAPYWQLAIILMVVFNKFIITLTTYSSQNTRSVMNFFVLICCSLHADEIKLWLTPSAKQR